MTVLVTGDAGFIGENLVCRLVTAGEHVRVRVEGVLSCA
jgi:nucleoside-diphosphate-sugar epimerase